MLPPLLSRWVDGLLGAQPPEEGLATCDRCAMQQPAQGEAPHASDVFFGSVKCCTYRPTLHNFLVGGILADGALTSHAGATLRAALANGAGVSPLGVVGTRPYWLLYEATPAAFGRSDALRCPYYDDPAGGCSVWAHRESVCATWFCKHERGAAGAAAWRALRDLLMHLERSVARACVLALDPGPEALAALFGRDADGAPNAAELDGKAEEAARRRTFGRWYGREAELFVACARHAATLSPSDVLAAGGAEAAALLRVARTRRDALAARPEDDAPIRLGRFEVVRAVDECARLKTYSSFDPLDVPRALLGALPRFDGRHVDEVLAEIAKEDGLALSPETLRALLDMGVLVPGDPERS